MAGGLSKAMSSVELTSEMVGSEGMTAALGEEAAKKGAMTAFKKTSYEKGMERLNMGIMGLEMSENMTEKMNQMGITDPKERTLLYFPTLMAMTASMMILPEKIIPGMNGAESRKIKLNKINKKFVNN